MGIVRCEAYNLYWIIIHDGLNFSFMIRLSFVASPFVVIKVIVCISVVLLSGCQFRPKFFGFEEYQLEHIQTNQFFLKQNDSVIGQVAAVYSREGETLPDIARHFSLGFNEIARTNKNLDVWQVNPDSKVLLPLMFILPDAPQRGIVINLANMRLFYYPAPNSDPSIKKVVSFPLGIGKKGWSTPKGETRIIRKTKAPNWIVPASIRREHALKGDPLPAVVKAGPDNPLGQFALRLGFPGYLLHGTNKPYGVGLRISHGCVRLYPEHIKTLFNEVSVGTPVRIVNQAFLLGWRDNMLYLSVHSEAKKQSKKTYKRIKRKLLIELRKRPEHAGAEVDWFAVKKILAEATGIPSPVLISNNFQVTPNENVLIVRRPEQLFGIPFVPSLSKGDWSVVASSFFTREPAIKLAAMLNHQGPQIPARVLEKNDGFQVVAGPFDSKGEAIKIAKRITREFEFDAKVQQIN